MLDPEVKEWFREIAERQKQTDEQFRKTDEQFRKTDDKFGKERELLNEKFIQTDNEIKKLSKLLGNIANNQGDVAEEFFFNTLRDTLKVGNLKFDDIAKNQFKERGGVRDEFDIFLTNGDSVAIVEVKYKAHENDIEKIKTKKVPNFRKLFPIYKDYKLYVGIAGFHINEDIVKKAEENGFFVLKRKGDIVEFDTSFMTAQTVFA